MLPDQAGSGNFSQGSLKAAVKVPGGKLLRVFLELEGKLIRRVRITGDFFVHPEESLPIIEDSLAGCILEGGELEARVAKAITDGKILVIGFSPKDLAKAILQAGKG